jgi:hypothetical protein
MVGGIVSFEGTFLDDNPQQNPNPALTGRRRNFNLEYKLVDPTLFQF